MDRSFSSSTSEPYEPLYNWVDDAEDVEQYSEGGYHPIHINDEIRNGRYLIVHKLGYSGYSTVWLAKDQQDNRFVALKLIVADVSGNLNETKILQHLATAGREHPGRKYVAMLLDEFEVHGPNGTHRCLVTDVVGPSVNKVRRLPLDIARKVALQCVSGLAFLHSCGVVHGGTGTLVLPLPFGYYLTIPQADLHTGNILLEIPDFHSWTVEQVYEHLGEPRKQEVQRVDGGPLTSSAPTYAVRPPNPKKFAQLFLNARCQIKITDFGESFLYKGEGALTPTRLATPIFYAAPEIFFDDSAVFGPGADIWALACTTYEILGNHKLLESFFGERDEVIVEMVSAFGKFPERWWNAWAEREIYCEEDGTLKVVPGTGPESSRPIDLSERLGGLLRREKAEIGKEELAMLERMLAKMMKYEPQDRIEAEQLLKDDWFKMVEMSIAAGP